MAKAPMNQRHAVLGRVHSNTQLSNGDHQSIMYMNPFGLSNESTLDKRAYYLDELLNTDFPWREDLEEKITQEKKRA